MENFKYHTVIFPSTCPLTPPTVWENVTDHAGGTIHTDSFAPRFQKTASTAPLVAELLAVGAFSEDARLKPALFVSTYTKTSLWKSEQQLHTQKALQKLLC